MASVILEKLSEIDLDEVQSYLRELAHDPRSWAIGCASLIGCYVLQFYWSTRSYPSGPTPIPLLGNILMFKNQPAIHEVLLNKRKRFGDVFTFYLGSKPNVVITDLELARQSFQLKDFAGRPHFGFLEELLKDHGHDIILTDYGRTWEVLRRVAFAAVRKYAATEKLATLVADVMDEAVQCIKDTHGEGLFDIKEYLYLATYNILAQSAYGKRYSIKDEEFRFLINLSKKQFELVDSLIILEFLPFLKWLPNYRRTWNEVMKLNDEQVSFIRTKYQEHLKDFDRDVIRDFADALIAAKEEAISEESDSAEQLNDANLAMVLFDLFSAGTDTTRITFDWMVLLMANWPEVQDRMREEIDEVLGDSVLDQDRRNQLNYCQAFISESLRFRNVVPMGVVHKTTCDTKIGDMKVPKDTAVHVLQWAIMHDPKHWDKPDVFNPNRFLDQKGRHNSRSHAAFVAFAPGRRTCPGEKMALADLLFMLTRFLQATKGYQVQLENGPGTANLVGKDEAGAYMPKEYKIRLKKVN